MCIEICVEPDEREGGNICSTSSGEVGIYPAPKGVLISYPWVNPPIFFLGGKICVFLCWRRLVYGMGAHIDFKRKSVHHVSEKTYSRIPKASNCPSEAIGPFVFQKTSPCQEHQQIRMPSVIGPHGIFHNMLFCKAEPSIEKLLLIVCTQRLQPGQNSVYVLAASR